MSVVESHRWETRVRCIVLTLMAGGSLALGADPAVGQSPMLAAAAVVHPPLHGPTPKKSDVIFSTRSGSPDALSEIKAYGANRVEWVYPSSPGVVEQLLSRGVLFGAALNSNSHLPSQDGYARDFDGSLLTAPWMKGWGVYWVTSASPTTTRASEDRLRLFIKMGAKSFQHDDPRMQMFAVISQAGDFSEASLSAFDTWVKGIDPRRLQSAGLVNYNGNYREWLIKTHSVKDAADYLRRFRSFPSTALWIEFHEQSILSYHLHLKRFASDLAGVNIANSMNLGGLTFPLKSNPFFFLAPVADYSIGETQIKDFSQQVSEVNATRSLGMGFVPTFKPGSSAENRVAIATFYALGAQPIVPWDVYQGNDQDGKPKRFYGRSGDYSPLYSFVSQHRELFDDLETAPLVGLVVPVANGDAQQIAKLVAQLSARNISYAYLPVGEGGRYAVDAARLKSLGYIVASNPESDYGGAFAAVAKAGLRVMSADEFSKLQGDAISPFQTSPGGENLRIVPRANPSDPNRLIIQIVDSSRGEQQPAEDGCRRRIGIRKNYLGPMRIISAKWYIEDQTGQTETSDSADFTYLTIPKCSLWSVLELKLSAARGADAGKK